MYTKEIRRLELILSAPFWRNNSDQCLIERLIIRITRNGSDFGWQMYDGTDGRWQKSSVPFASIRAAKAALSFLLQEHSRRLREEMASTR